MRVVGVLQGRLCRQFGRERTNGARGHGVGLSIVSMRKTVCSTRWKVRPRRADVAMGRSRVSGAVGVPAKQTRALEHVRQRDPYREVGDLGESGHGRSGSGRRRVSTSCRRRRWARGAQTRAARDRLRSAEQLIRRLGNRTALEARAVEVDRARLALALAAGDRGRAVGAAAGDLIQRHLALEAVRQADDDHPEVQQVGDDREQRYLLPAMLGRGRREGAADLAVERASHPQPASLVEEGRHLRRHATEARRCADNDGVVVRQLVDAGQRRGLVELEVRRLGGCLGRGFGNTLEVDAGAGRARALGDGGGHRLDVAVAGVIENENLGHDDSWGGGWVDSGWIGAAQRASATVDKLRLSARGRTPITLRRVRRAASARARRLGSAQRRHPAAGR